MKEKKEKKERKNKEKKEEDKKTWEKEEKLKEIGWNKEEKGKEEKQKWEDKEKLKEEGEKDKVERLTLLFTLNKEERDQKIEIKENNIGNRWETWNPITSKKT